MDAMDVVLGSNTLIYQDGYGVSVDGEIFSYWFRVKGKGRVNLYEVDYTRLPKKLKPRSNSGGYWRASLGRGSSEYVHRVVWKTFHGEIPSGMQVRHWDGDPSNNKLKNLRIGTQSDNENDKKRVGTHISGEQSVHSKLTVSQVIQARRLYKEGNLHVSEIHSLLNVTASYSTLCGVIVGGWPTADQFEGPARKRGRLKSRK